MAFALGTLGLPHILMRFLTVPNARAARRSIGWAVGLIGVFYVFVAIIGLGGRAILGDAGVKLGGKSGNLIAPYLAQHLAGGPGSAGGDIFFARDQRDRVHHDPRGRGRGRAGRGGRRRPRRLRHRLREGEPATRGDPRRPSRGLVIGAVGARAGARRRPRRSTSSCLPASRSRSPPRRTSRRCCCRSRGGASTRWARGRHRHRAGRLRSC